MRWITNFQKMNIRYDKVFSQFARKPWLTLFWFCDLAPGQYSCQQLSSLIENLIHIFCQNSRNHNCVSQYVLLLHCWVVGEFVQFLVHGNVRSSRNRHRNLKVDRTKGLEKMMALCINTWCQSAAWNQGGHLIAPLASWSFGAARMASGTIILAASETWFDVRANGVISGDAYQRWLLCIRWMTACAKPGKNSSNTLRSS